MSGKKRDNRGRLLKTGERQREDGRYEYRYKDVTGKSRSIYSWRLVESDKNPPGKRSKSSLREMAKIAERDLEDGIRTYESQRTTLNCYFDRYIDQKVNLKQSTSTNYKYMYNKYVRDDLGNLNIGDIKYSDIKRFYVYLLHDLGFKPNSIEIIHTILHPIFSIAVRDGDIRINPTDGVMQEIKREYDWEKPKRNALSESQQAALVDYIARSKTYSKWRTIITVLLGTGCRIGEVIGLRWEDCDFSEGVISINHNLIYRQQDNGKCEFHITTPKTRAGVRIIPMLSDVRDALTREKKSQFISGTVNKKTIDGYSGFIFSNRYGNVLNPHSVNRALCRIIKSYNEEETEKAQSENREPILLPHFSVHNLRHTFCTRFCEQETNLKVIQEIMGHADISTTMDIYNEATKEKKMDSFAALEGKIKIS